MAFLAGGTPLFSQQTSAEDFFNQAQNATSEKEKIDLLQQAIQLQPEHLKARLELGQLFLKNSQFNKAKEQFSAAALATQDSKALELLGDTYVKLGQVRDAINAYETAFQQNTANTQPYFKMLELQISERQYSDAEDKIKTFIRKFGVKNPDAWYYWGKVSLAKNDLKEAENGFRSALKHEPNHTRAKAALAQLALAAQVIEIEQHVQSAIDAKNIDLANQKLNEIKKIDPAFNTQKWRTEIAKIYWTQANSTLAANDPEAAYRLFLKAQEYDPNLAGLKAQISHLENAINQTEKLANFYTAGKNAMTQENWGNAVSNFEQIVRLQPDYQDARALLTTARQKIRAENKPEEIPAPVDQPEPNPATLFEDGLLLCAEKNWDAANEKFDSVLRLQPDDKPALGMKSLATGLKLLDAAQWPPALAHFNNGLEALPQNETLLAARYYAEARIALEQKESETARQKFLAIQKLGVQFRDTQTLLADLMKTTSAKAEPVRSFEKIKPYAPYVLGIFLLAALSFIWKLARKKPTSQPADTTAATLAKTKPRRPSEEIKTVTRVAEKKPVAEDEPVFLEDIDEEEVVIDDEPTSLAEQETLVAGAGAPPKRHQGRYEMKGEIGRGAMGKVYRAYDHKMERMIVLKEIRMDKAHDHEEYDKLKKRFLREARSAGRLHHANIVTVFDIINQGSKLYISMEYLDGVNLLKYLQKHQIVEPKKASQIIHQACQALYYAHQAGIVHRDIKPSNLMIQHDGQVKIVDFGVAKDTDSTTLTLVGSSLGTPSYMSPEQIEGKNVDGRSDIFALGVMFYEMITGERPFKGETMASIIIKIIQSQPKRITTIKKNLPVELETIILKMLEKDPEKRYQTGLEVAQSLEEARMI
jgi:tRNA A-37 threonylcarbamoyl transferase component Bud32/uncharacterized protein HemY